MINLEMHLTEELSAADGHLTKKPMRDGYGEELALLAKEKQNIVAVVADLADSLRLDILRRNFPERIIEVGIQEQNMMSLAAGLAMSGKVPTVNSIACFSPGNNLSQLTVSVCLTKENVKIIGGHAGFGNGVDGANQQAFGDIATTRVLPNLTVLVPADYEQVKKATRAMINHFGPVYMRITKPSREVVTTEMTPFEIGKAQILQRGRDATIFACGVGVSMAMRAALELVGTVEVEVVNVHTIKPFDKETVIRSAKKTGKVITVEEHSITGGLAGAVAEVLTEEAVSVKMVRIGMEDVFGESGEPDELLVKYGIDKERIVNEIKKLVNL